MSRLLITCALIGVALGTPTPTKALPKSVLGIFENVPSESKNFEEFVTVFGLPKHAKFDTNNLIGFWKEGDTYHQWSAYWPSSLTFDLPFKLGNTQTTTILGKQFEYVYTLETGATPETPVLRVKFRQVDGDIEVTVEAAFTKNGITATYARDNIVAKRTYRRTLPSYALGAFGAERITDESREFFNTIYPLPGGLKWTQNTSFVLFRDGDYFVDRVIVSPDYHISMRFKFDEPKTIKVGNDTVTATYSLVEASINKTTIRTEMTSSKGQMVWTSVFDRNGAAAITIKTENKEFTNYYKRRLPWMLLGTFEEVPEKAENWEEFMKRGEIFKDANATKEFRIYKKSDAEYVFRKVISDKKFEIPLILDSSSEATLPPGKQMKFNTTLLYGNSTYLIIQSEIEGKKFTMDLNARACGIEATYRRGDVEAKKYFRRVISKTVLGNFESPEFEGDEDLKKFVAAHGAQDVLKKTTVEFSETPEHKYHKKMTTEGEEPIETTFVLGEPVEITCKKTGKTVTTRNFYHEVDNQPTLMTAFFTPDKKPFMGITQIFNSQGFQATVVYNQEGRDKISRRTFTRSGAAVPFELPNAA